MINRFRDLINADGIEVSARKGKLAKSASALTVLESSPSIDVSRMTANAVINTDVIDYENAVILASGVSLHNYINNPAVLFEHGLNQNVSLPLGVAEDENGVLAVDRSEFEIEAKTYFSQRNPFAQQVFGLIDEGVMRATSIQVVPTKKSVYADPDGNKFDVTEESVMVEFSWCCLGVNPEALKKSASDLFRTRYESAFSLQTDNILSVLERGSLGTDRLLAPMRKSLIGYVPETAASSPGFDFDQEKEMSKKVITAAEAKRLSADDIKAIVADGKEIAKYEPKSQALLKSMFAEPEPKSASGKEEEPEEKDESPEPEKKVMTEADVKGMSDDSLKKMLSDEKMLGEYDEKSQKMMGSESDRRFGNGSEKKSLNASDMKPVAREVTYTHRMLKSVVAEAQERLTKKVDGNDLSETALGVLETVNQGLDVLAGEFSESYPDYPALNGESEEVELVVEPEFENQLRSLLSGSEKKRFQSLGLLGRLRVALSDDGTPEAERKSAGQAALRSFEKLATEAKSFVPPAPADVVSKADHEAAVSALGEERDAAITALQELRDVVRDEFLPAT